MRFISKALCLLAVATIGLAAGIPFNEELREITLEDILNFEKNVQSVQIDTSDPLIVEEASLSVVSFLLVIFAWLVKFVNCILLKA